MLNTVAHISRMGIQLRRSNFRKRWTGKIINKLIHRHLRELPRRSDNRGETTEVVLIYVTRVTKEQMELGRQHGVFSFNQGDREGYDLSAPWNIRVRGIAEDHEWKGCSRSIAQKRIMLIMKLDHDPHRPQHEQLDSLLLEKFVRKYLHRSSFVKRPLACGGFGQVATMLAINGKMTHDYRVVEDQSGSGGSPTMGLGVGFDAMDVNAASQQSSTWAIHGIRISCRQLQRSIDHWIHGPCVGVLSHLVSDCRQSHFQAGVVATLSSLIYVLTLTKTRFGILICNLNFLAFSLFCA